jgi:ABC-type amino acid transport system permease subunit
MRTDRNALRFVPDLEETAVRRIVRTGLALAGLLFLLGLLAVLPGVDRLLAGLAVSLEALVLAVATALVVGALLRVAPVVERVVEGALDGPKGAVGHAAAGAKLLVGFVAVTVAYRGFAPAVAPTFRAFDGGGLYHLGFLLAGLAVLASLARRLYRCWDPVTRLVTAYVMDATGDDHRRYVATDR